METYDDPLARCLQAFQRRIGAPAVKIRERSANYVVVLQGLPASHDSASLTGCFAPVTVMKVLTIATPE
jgi:hypothetical protein